ncbi:SPOR domain-containing protein [Variovorax sp. VNK109]|uniref:SPOR domain-containing protein n=1 Tax=Variovorax sp. VNK109 TaxID=3400919 RepID=UPI003C02EB6B
MLRLLFLLLLLANGVYYAWTQGFLREMGMMPVRQTEPERMAAQVRPEAVRVISEAEAKRDTPSRGPECLQAGLLDDTQATTVRQTLETWPAANWTLEPGTEPARWMIYMGRYPDVETLNRKKAELRQLRVLFQTLPNPQLEPGVSLGSFDSQDKANQQLASLAQRGVRTARVMQERPEVKGQTLRLTSLDDALRARLNEVRAVLGNKPLQACR